MKSKPCAEALRIADTFAAWPPTIICIERALLTPVAAISATWSGRAGESGEFDVRVDAFPILSIAPGPHPRSLREYKPNWFSTTSTVIALLVPCAVSTVREPEPAGARRGIQASMFDGSTRKSGRITICFPCLRMTRASLRLLPSRTPSIKKREFLAIAVPVSVEGMRLAEFTIPFWLIAGGCA